MKSIYVENIKCHGCMNQIQKKLTAIENVDEVEIELESGKIIIEGNEHTDYELILQTLKKMGYPEMGHSSTRDKAMSYVSCMIGRIS